MKRNWLGIFFVFIFAIIGSACATEEQQGSAEENNDNEAKRLQIYTTLFAWEDFAKKIGGEEVEVENVVPAGSDVLQRNLPEEIKRDY